MICDDQNAMICIEATTSVTAPAHITPLQSTYSACSLRTHSESSLTLPLLEPNLNLAELVLGSLQPLPQFRDVGSMRGRGQQRCLLTHTYYVSLL